MKRLLARWVCVLLLVFLPGMSFASPVQWTGTGGNGNYYEIFEIAYLQSGEGLNKAYISWEEARDWAANLTYVNGGQTYIGHLASITSETESTFVKTLFGDDAQDSYLIGAYQTPPDPEIDYDQDWHWVTGEEWDYTEWRLAGSEPNNTFGYSDHHGFGLSEQYLEFWGKSTKNPGDSNYLGFNDLLVGAYTSVIDRSAQFNNGKGYIVEYEPAGISSVPEPGTFMLLGLSLLGMAGVGRKK